MEEEYKIEIKKIQNFPLNHHKLTNCLIRVKSQSTNEKFQIAVGQAIGFSFNIEAIEQINLLILVITKQDKEIILGKGSLILNVQDIDRSGLRKKCLIKNSSTQQILMNVEFLISNDWENNGCESFVSKLSQESKIIPNLLDNLNSEKEHSHSISEKSPRKHLLNLISKRKFGCKINKKDKNMNIMNQIQEDSSTLIEKFKLKIDEPIQEIKFLDHKECIAVVSFDSNPTPQELQQIQLKIPQHSNQILLQIQKMDGQKYYSKMIRPSLAEYQSKRLNLRIVNSQKEEKGILYLNYKIQEQQKMNEKNEKLALGDGYQKMEQEGFGWKNKLFQQIEEQKQQKMPKQSNKKQKRQEKSQNQRFSTQNISSIINNNKILSSNVICESFLPIIKKNQATQKEQESSPTLKANKNLFTSQKRGKTDFKKISAISYDVNQSQIDSYKSNSVIQKLKINHVSIKMSPQYFSYCNIDPVKQSQKSKCLQIYTNPSRIYRSSTAFGASILNWSLEDYEMNINQFERLICEVSYSQDKLIIGEINVSFNQLKFNYTHQSFFKGKILKDAVPIATITIDYALMNNPTNSTGLNNTRMRSKTLNKSNDKITNGDNGTPKYLYLPIKQKKAARSITKKKTRKVIGAY